MKRRSVLKLGATAVAFGAVGARFAAPASAQQKMVLKATDVHPLGYPTVEAVVRYDGPDHYAEHTAHLRAWFGDEADDVD